jgi:hypothetical protein
MAEPFPSSEGRANPGSARSRQRSVPSLPTVLASIACFLVIFEFLAFELRSGRDPAIGASTGKPTADRPRPVVIHRRIIVRRVIESAPGASSVPVTGGDSSSSGFSSTAAPAATSAVPPVAPAPAPAPVTSAS